MSLSPATDRMSAPAGGGGRFIGGSRRDPSEFAILRTRQLTAQVALPRPNLAKEEDAIPLVHGAREELRQDSRCWGGGILI